MFESVGCGDPSRRIHSQQVPDKVVQTRRHVVFKGEISLYIHSEQWSSNVGY